MSLIPRFDEHDSAEHRDIFMLWILLSLLASVLTIWLFEIAVMHLTPMPFQYGLPLAALVGWWLLFALVSLWTARRYSPAGRRG